MEFWFRGKRLSDDQWEYGGVDDKSASIISHHQFIPIDPDTLGLFTGITDVDGQGIYHGDILRIVGSKSQLLIMVLWTNWKFTIKPYRAPHLEEFMTMSRFSWNQSKVVGNIWDGVVDEDDD